MVTDSSPIGEIDVVAVAVWTDVCGTVQSRIRGSAWIDSKKVFFIAVEHVFLRRHLVTVGFSGGLFRISHVPGPEHLDGSQRVHSAH